ncbi:MAG: T9SS type A sorting domain-containing protein [Bacteroidota bacterium]
MIQSGRLFFFFFFTLLNIHLASAQFFFQRYDSIQVKVNGFYITNPWAGGLNFVQVSDIDMNMDGIKDLFVFDRTGNKIRTFINKGTIGNVDYRYDHRYESKFPKLTDWALLVDYNCDGKEDIFSYSIPWGAGFDVYKNTSTATELQFQKVATQVRSQFNPPGLTTFNLYVSSVDVPAITDIDNDGDLDVITFGNSSNTMEYHQNQSMELYGTCDSLKFKLRNRCWGYAEENGLTNDFTLNVPCPSNVPNPEITPSDKDIDGTINSDRSPERHAGGCELCIDLDADGDKEFIVGDISYNNLVILTNGGSPTAGFFTAKDMAFPANTTSTSAVNLSIFPCGYYEDVNFDGARDLLVSPNAANVSENFNSLVYYKNMGADDAPDFEFQQSNLLQDNMIDVGEGASPVFFDYDNDGLKDLFIGNYGYYNALGYEHKIAQFKNIGTATIPKFELITRDYNNYSSLGIYNMIPAFGDMDADGDADMMLGGADGRLQYFENTGGTGMANFTTTPTQVNFKNSNNRMIDVGDFAAPQIVDVDGDNKKDLVIGARNGKIAYYKHIGSGTEAIPAMDSITHFFGNIKINEPGYVTGYTHPFIFKQGGVTKLLTGTENGYLYLYGNIDGNLTGAFTPVDSSFMNVWEGERTTPHLADINNDGYLDMAVGNYQGGVIFLKGVSALSVNDPDNTIQWSFDLFPNPADHSITIRIRNEKNSAYQLELYNVMGQLINTQKILSTTTLNTEQLSQGIYVCKITELSNSGEVNSGSLIKRIVIQH